MSRFDRAARRARKNTRRKRCAQVNRGDEARAQAFVDGLNWVVGSTWTRGHGKRGRQFCSRRCRDSHDAAVLKGSSET